MSVENVVSGSEKLFMTSQFGRVGENDIDVLTLTMPICHIAYSSERGFCTLYTEYTVSTQPVTLYVYAFL